MSGLSVIWVKQREPSQCFCCDLLNTSNSGREYTFYRWLVVVAVGSFLMLFLIIGWKSSFCGVCSGVMGNLTKSFLKDMILVHENSVLGRWSFNQPLLSLLK